MVLDFYHLLCIPYEKDNKHIEGTQFIVNTIKNNIDNEPLVYQLICLIRKHLIELSEIMGYSLYKLDWFKLIADLNEKCNNYKVLSYPIKFLTYQSLDLFLGINEKLLEISMFSEKSEESYYFIDTLFNNVFNNQFQEITLTVISYLMRVSTKSLNSNEINSGINVSTLLSKNASYVYDKFMKLITEISGNSPHSGKNSVMLILPLIREVVTESPRCQQLRQQIFVTLNIFIYLTNILTSFPEQGGKDYQDLVKKVLETIYILIVSNKTTKAQFEVEVGHNQLYKILTCNENSVISNAAMDELLKITTENTSKDYKNCTIFNQNILKVYVKLIPKCPKERQITYMENIAALVNGEQSAHNMSVTSVNMNPPLLDLLVDIYPQLDPSVISLTMSVIISIGINSISIGQLKRLFNIMKSDGEYRNPNCKLLVDAFYQMLMHCTSSGRFTVGPARFILCDGRNSGINIKTSFYNNEKILEDKNGLPGFPQSGYTFSMWVNVNSYVCPFKSLGEKCDGQCNYAPYLYLFRDINGNSLECYILNQELIIEVHTRQTNIIHTNIIIEKDKWTHIVITHQTSYIMRQGELMVYINNELKFNKTEPYPSMGETLLSYIGTGGETVKDGITKEHNSLNGRFGSVYLLNKCLTSNQINGLYLLGPDYMYTFADLKTDHIIIPYNNGVENISSLCNGTLTNSICIAINGSVYKDNILINNTQKESYPIVWKDTKYSYTCNDIKGEILNGTHCLYSRHISEIFDTMGGISVFYPLFTQVDLKDKETNDYIADPSITTSLLNIIKCKLINITNYEEIIEKRIIEVLSFIFENLSPENYNKDTLRVLIEIIESKEIPIEIQKKFVKLFLVNMKIWIYTPSELQLAVFEEIIKYAKKDIKSFSEDFNTQYFLDMLDRYYYYEIDIPSDDDLRIHKGNSSIRSRNPSIAGHDLLKSLKREDKDNELLTLDYYILLQNERLHPYSHKVVGKRPSYEELQLLRFQIIQIVTLLLQSNGLIQPQQVFNLYCNVIKKNYKKNTDKSHLMEILNLILILFSDEKQVDQFATHSTGFLLMDNKGTEGEIENYLLPFNGPHSLLSLLSNPSSDVRLTAISIICMLINRAVEVKDKKFERKDCSGTLWDFLGISVKALDDYFVQFGRLLSQYELTRTTYEQLFLSMTGHDRGDNEGTLIITQLLKTLYICTSNTNFDVLLLFMTDLRSLLTKNSKADENREIFINIPNWQKDLLSFYEKLFKKKDQLNSDNQLNFIQVSQWVIDIFTILHLHSLHSKGEEGVNLMSDSISYICELNVEIRSTLYLDTLWNIMQRLLAEEKLRQENKTPLKPLTYVTFFNFCKLIEESLECPPELDPPYDITKRWKLSDILNQLINILSPTIINTSPSLINSFLTIPQGVLTLNLRTCISLTQEVAKNLVIENRNEHNDSTLTNYSKESINRLSNLINNNEMLYNHHFIVYHTVSALHSILSNSNIPPSDEWYVSINEILNNLVLMHRNRLRDLIQYATDMVPKSIFKKPPENIVKKSQILTENAQKLMEMTFIINEWKHHMEIILQTLYNPLPPISIIDIPSHEELQEKREDNITDLYKRNVPITSGKILPVKDTEDIVVLFETKRIISSIEDSIKKHDATKGLWNRLLGELSHERGAWGNEDLAIIPSTQKFYKLDKLYNVYGVRNRIKLDIRGTNHPLSSIWDDKDKKDYVEDTLLSDENELINEISQTKSVEEHEPLKPILQAQKNKEKTLFKAEVELITPILAVKGELYLYNKYIVFSRDAIYDTQLYQGKDVQNKGHGVKKQYLLKAGKSKKIDINTIKSVESRRYELRHIAAEIYIDTCKSYLFNFKTNKLRDTFINRLNELHIKTIEPYLGSNPIEVLKKKGITELWQKHEMSNFEYLLELNKVAGRTYYFYIL